MQRTSNVFARVEPEIKEQAEQILSQLGIPMSNAIGLFLRQVIMQRGIPFDVKLMSHKPIAIGNMSAAELNSELEKGYAAWKAIKIKKQLKSRNTARIESVQFAASMPRKV